MKPKLVAALLAGVLVPADDAGSATDAVEKSLRQLNDAFVSRDAGTLRKLMIADHISITPYAGREGRDKQIQSLPNYTIEKYSTEKMKANAIAKDVVLLTYEVRYSGTYKGKALAPRSMASSIWVRRDGRWQEAVYQETPVGKE
jgi:hypothetical protein